MILKKTAAAAAACLVALSASLCAHAATTQSGNAVEFDSAADFRIAAMYSENGEFVGVQKFSTERGFIDYSKLAQNADGECKVKIFSWDSSSLEPKADMIENKTAVFSTLDLDIETTAQGAASVDSYKEIAAEQVARYNSIYVTTDNIQSKEYKLSENTKLFVNGVEVSWNADNLYTYLITSKVGRVTLANTAGTDDSYNIVSVTYYKSAVISDVVGDKIYFDMIESDMSSSMALDQTRVDAGDLTYTITLDGEQISPSDLRENDVISVAYDVSNDFDDSDFYDIIVSRNIVKGVIEKDDEENETYTVNGTEYKYDWTYLPDGYDSDAVGLDAILYVDAFGRVVNILENKENIKIAILENVYANPAYDAEYVSMVLPDGSTTEYALRNSNDAQELLEIIYVDGDKNRGKNPVCDRIIKYKLNYDNELYSAESFRGSDKKQQIDEEYSAKTNKIGLIAMNDNTKILDLCDYISSGKTNDINAISPSKLVDEVSYTAYGYNKLYDGSFTFVIITDGIGAYTDKTQPAVFVKNTTALDNNGDACDAVVLLYNGEEKTYILDGVDAYDLNKGDVIVFKTNYDDEINRIDVIASMELCSGSDRIDCAQRSTNITPTPIDEWDYTTANGYDTYVDLDYGAVINKSGDFIELAAYGKDYDSIYKLTSETKVYVYDYTSLIRSALYVGTASDITKTIIPYSARDNGYILWDNLGKDTINYAFVKSIDGDIDTILFVKAPQRNTPDPTPDYTSIKAAIAEDFRYDNTTSTTYVKLTLPDATSSEFAVDANIAEKVSEIINTTNDSEETVKKDITERVVEYELNNDGVISKLSLLRPIHDQSEYIKSFNRVGRVNFNENTALLDVSGYSEGKINRINELKDGYTEYEVYGYGHFEDDTYAFVLITGGIGSYSDGTQIAVFLETTSVTDNDGNTQDAMSVLYDGEEKQYIIDGTAPSGLNKGDVIIFNTNSSDEINQIDVIAQMNLYSGTNRMPYDYRDTVEPVVPRAWDRFTNPDTEVELAYGRIVDKTSRDFTLVPANMWVTSYSDEMCFDLTSDTKVYVYSYKNPNKSALYVGTVSDIIKTSIPKAAQDADTDDIDWTHSALELSTNYAFVKSIDGDAAEVFVVIAPGNADY